MESWMQNRVAGAVKGALQAARQDDGEPIGVGDELAEMLTRMSRAEQRPLNPGERLSEDGLIYCSICGAPKQCRIPNSITPGEMLRCPITCMCERKQIEAEIAEDKRRADMRRISELRGASLMSERLRAATFDCWQPQNAAYFACMDYVDRFDEMLSTNQGLLFYGPTGTGKTFAAACIANALLDRGVPVLMTSMVRLMAVLGRDDDEARIHEAMNRAKLLVIDDLGAERGTSFGLEKAYGFIDARYLQSKPMIITTNLALDKMQSEEQLSYMRIYDRIIQFCYPVEFMGPSRRLEEAASRFDAMRRVWAR